MSLAVSMRNVDPAFQGAGQKAYPLLRKLMAFHTFASKNGSLRHEIHYWLGKDTSQDEAGTAAIKTLELDAALGGRSVQYREVQGNESDKFRSLFKPCIMPLEGAFATGAKPVKESEYKTRLLACKGKHIVPFARSTLNHDNIFILDTKSKIFQFNGSNTSIQERAKALEVAQYIRDNYHDSKFEIAAIEDGKLMADAASGEFWALFGGFAPLLRKSGQDEDTTDSHSTKKLLSIVKGKAEPVGADSLKRELMATDNCYILDCGLEVYLWMGRSTSLNERKNASKVAEEFIRGSNRSNSRLIHVIEGFETVVFRSKFESWPQTTNATVTEDGKGKVAALLQRQGVNVKGLLKVDTEKEDPEEYIDCTGHLQGHILSSILILSLHQFTDDSIDLYTQYSYSGEEKEEHLIGTWLGKQSIEKDRASAVSQANKMVESMKFTVAQACIHEGSEPVLFLLIFQSFIVFKGGLSDGYKNYIAEKGIPDDTYTEDGLALFRVQGSGPENMQAIQVEAFMYFVNKMELMHFPTFSLLFDQVPSSLNSSYCYILHSGTTVFTWAGSLTSPDDQDIVERQLDLIKPELQTRPQKEGAEFEQFWELIGGKPEHIEYPNQKISSVPESDPHLFSCTFSKGNLKVTEIYNFTQDDLMTEDISVLDCRSNIFVWVGQQVDTKNKLQALTIGEKFLENDILFENLSHATPIYIVIEGSEPPFFTRFFTWDSAKSNMHGNSFQRKLAIMKHGGTPVEKPKRRVTASFGGRSSGGTEKPQRSRSVSFSPDRPRVRGRSPAFNKLAANFENPKDRNLSTPPPMVAKLYPKSGTQEVATKSAAIAALTKTFDRTSARESLMPRTVKASPAEPKKVTAEPTPKEKVMSSRLESLTIKEDVKEGEHDDDGDEEGVPIYPYERLKTTSEDPVTEIDVTKREVIYYIVLLGVYDRCFSYTRYNVDLPVGGGVQGEVGDEKG
ncbi:hypothetical protein V6N12_004445 [Hibiscus sabdariffa]|uniref:Gelsolin-like domain-containing protein n=1 Tax=Hibiscus sabdariffa TaxID=183260 RepID=A0ABR2CLI5_9ROSI